MRDLGQRRVSRRVRDTPTPSGDLYRLVVRGGCANPCFLPYRKHGGWPRRAHSPGGGRPGGSLTRSAWERRDMPREDDTEQRIIEALAAHDFSKRAMSEILGIRRQVFNDMDDVDFPKFEDSRKYADKTWENIDAALPDDIDREEYVTDKFLPDDATDADTDPKTTDPYEDPTAERLRVVDNPDEVTPGEWLEQFFDDLEVGIKSKFTNLQARRADRKNELPDEDKMLHDLKNMASGVKGEAAQYVAEEYWEAVQDYISETRTDVFRGANGEASGQAGSQGGFVSVDGQNQQQGEWVQMPDGSRQYGRFEPDGQGGKRFVPMQPPQQQGMMGQQGGMQSQQHNPEVQALREELRDLRSEMSSGGSNGMREQIEELIQLREAMKELQSEGAQGADEGMQMLRQELRALRQEMGGGGQPAGGDTPRERLMNRLVADDSIDAETAMEALERIEGQTDPDVREKEIEMELEEQKMQQKQERQERILSSVESVVETAAGAVAERLRQDPNGGGQQQAADGAGQPGQVPDQQRGQPQRQSAPQPEQRAPAEPETWECPECGAETEQNPRLGGKRCGACDFSRVPCPDCARPIDIPPEHEREEGGCPKCGEFVPLPEDLDNQASCLSCDWMGDASDAAGEMVECGNCEAVHPVGPDPEV